MRMDGRTVTLTDAGWCYILSNAVHCIGQTNVTFVRCFHRGDHDNNNNTNNQTAWQSPAWWSPSAVLQTPNVCGNMLKLCYHDNRGQLSPVWIIPLHCLTPKTTTLVKESTIYLLYKPSYSQFYVQIVNVSLPWQQGSVGDQFKRHRETGRPRKTRTRDISPMQAVLKLILCSNTQIFVERKSY